MKVPSKSNGDTTTTTTTTSLTATTASSDGSFIVRVAVGSANPAKIKAVEQAFQKCLSRKEHTTTSTTTDDNTTQQQQSPKYTLQILGFAVESGVSSQPFGDEVTCQGAKNRAQAAYVEYKKQTGSFPHMAVGMEGGVEFVPNRSSSTTSSSSTTMNGDKKTAGKSKQQDEEEQNNNSLYCMAWMAIYGKRQPSTIDVFASQETTTYIGDKKPFFGLAKTATFLVPPVLTKMIVQDGMELGQADDKFFSRTNSNHGSGSVGLLTDGLIDRAGYYESAIILALTPWIRPELYPQ